MSFRNTHKYQKQYPYIAMAKMKIVFYLLEMEIICNSIKVDWYVVTVFMLLAEALIVTHCP